jgi:hypothetical protein
MARHNLQSQRGLTRFGKTDDFAPMRRQRGTGFDGAVGDGGSRHFCLLGGSDVHFKGWPAPDASAWNEVSTLTGLLAGRSGDISANATPPHA